MGNTCIYILHACRRDTWDTWSYINSKPRIQPQHSYIENNSFFFFHPRFSSYCFSFVPQPKTVAAQWQQTNVHEFGAISAISVRVNYSKTRSRSIVSIICKKGYCVCTTTHRTKAFSVCIPLVYPLYYWVQLTQQMKQNRTTANSSERRETKHVRKLQQKWQQQQHEQHEQHQY